MKIFALNSSHSFGIQVAAHLGVPLSAHEEQEFEDGEHQCRPLETVRGKDIFVVQSLFNGPDLSVHDKFCRLLFFISTLKDAGACHITAVVPYLCYARKDQKAEPRGSVTSRYVATLLEAAGTDQIITMDVHDVPAYQNAFRIPSENLQARVAFIDFLLPLIGRRELAVLSPDVGGIKRAEAFQQSLQHLLGKEIPLAFMEKYRSAGKLSGGALIGEVKRRTILLVDDMISTGGTVAKALAACKSAGVISVWAVATHGVFCGSPAITLKDEILEKIITANTIPPSSLQGTAIEQRLHQVDVTSLFASAIRHIQEQHTVTNLIKE